MNQIVSILAVFLCLLSTISGAAKESFIPPTKIEMIAGKAQKPIMEAGMYEDTFISSSNRKIYYTLRIPENMTENMPIIVWLHGANGMTGTWVQNHKGVAVAADNLNEERFIIIQPQSYGNWFERYIRYKTDRCNTQGITIVCYALYNKLKRYKGVFQKIIYAS